MCLIGDSSIPIVNRKRQGAENHQLSRLIESLIDSFKQTLHRMCLIGDSIPIVNRLALLTMRCQLSNVRITFVILLRIVVLLLLKRIYIDEMLV